MKEKLERYSELLNFTLHDNNETIYNYAIKNKIPVIRKNTAKLLKLLIILKKPKKILEIGTGSAYSTKIIYDNMPSDARFISIERDKKRYISSLEIFKNCDKILLLNVDFFTYVKDCKEVFDFIFLDAQKRDYIDYLEIIPDILEKQGVFLVDNYLFGDRVILEEENIEDKYKNGVKLIKEFNRRLAESKQFETVFMPFDDGVILSIKK